MEEKRKHTFQEEYIMKKKTTAILLAVVTAASLAAGCGSKDAGQEDGKKKESSGTKKTDKGENQTLKKAESSELGNINDGKFIIGFDQDFPPMGFVDEEGEYTGFDIELAAEVAKRLNLTFVPQPIAWEAKNMELSSGTIDCIWNGFTMTGREEDYTWSDPYLKNRQVFVVNGDSIKSFDDLAGKTVEVQADSSAEKALQKNEDLSSSFSLLQTVPDYNTAMMDLEQGAVDAIAMDEVVAAYQLENKKGDMQILDGEISQEEYAIGFLKGNEKLRDNVQKTLEEMAEEGVIASISEKWFGSDISTLGK